ncbi:unnamed protein product [Vitrella brassicaformis CCMP3155]|uniref:Rubisco LSMT substrate-binding domain-containing protein n=2 Tax=Vitrella brassicaformis TaxID=1169539 RepID=A0A0G4FFI2_VITBC|nr:unnamed protein product [Vitrella brassicaformis CCMP3155]|eukprot:CEM11951.1 unnamed protein product [Vitrella brassicaformis CCMP3155]
MITTRTLISFALLASLALVRGTLSIGHDHHPFLNADLALPRPQLTSSSRNEARTKMPMAASDTKMEPAATLATHHPAHSEATPAARRISSPDLDQLSADLGLFRHPAVALGEFAMAEGAVRGLIATDTVKAGEIMLGVPKYQTLEALSSTSKGARADANPFPFLSDGYCGEAPWDVRMALTLLYEKRQGEASDFSSWISLLPKSGQTTVPFFWQESEIAALQCPYIQQRLRAQQQKWRDGYRKLRAAMLEARAAGRETVDISEDDFFWALDVVRSRSIATSEALYDFRFLPSVVGFSVAEKLLSSVLDTPEWLSVGLNTLAAIFFSIFAWNAWRVFQRQGGSRFLIPGIDLLNHSSHTETTVEFNGLMGQFEVPAAEGKSPNEQICLNYGARSNDQLLQQYGFIEEGNPHDTYVIDIIKTLRDPQCISQLRAMAANNGDDEFFATKDDGSERLAERLLKRLQQLQQQGYVDMLRTLVIERRVGGRACFDSGSQQLIRFLVAHGDQETNLPLQRFGEEVSESNERRASVVLRAAAATELSKLPTTLEQDLTELDAGASGSQNIRAISTRSEPRASQRERLAVRYRVEKKRLLREATS